MEDKLLTVKEAAEILRVHPVTVSEWCRKGILRAAKVGSRWRIKPGDLARAEGYGTAEDYHDFLLAWVEDLKSKSPNNPVFEWIGDVIEAAHNNYNSKEG